MLLGSLLSILQIPTSFSSAGIVTRMAHSYVPQAPHPAVPKELRLSQVVVICRHGDRAPISKTLGSILEENETQELWLSKLPSQESMAQWETANPVQTLKDRSAAAAATAAAAAAATVDGCAAAAAVDPPPAAEEPPWGQLTQRGADELEALGRHLRPLLFSTPESSSAALFPATELPAGNVFVRSTHMRRTQQSAQNLLRGLGLPADGAIPVLFRPAKDETLYPNAKRTGARQFELIAAINERHRSEEQDLLEARVAKAIGASELRWTAVREVLTCHEAHAVPLPSPLVTPELVADVVRFVSRQWGTWFRDPELARLSIGPFLGEILAAMGVVSATRTAMTSAAAAEDGEGPAAPKLVVFAGHDTTLIPILCALDIYADEWPGYGSYITLELAEREDAPETGQRLVRVVYNGAEVTLPRADSPWLPMNEFRRRLEPLAMSAEETEAAKAAATQNGGAGAAAAEIRGAMGGAGKGAKVE